jgi:hypothetical protein
MYKLGTETQCIDLNDGCCGGSSVLGVVSPHQLPLNAAVTAEELACFRYGFAGVADATVVRSRNAISPKTDGT